MPQVSCTIPLGSSQIVKELSKISGESQSSILAQAIEKGLPGLTEQLIDRSKRLDRLVSEIFEEGNASRDRTGGLNV